MQQEDLIYLSYTHPYPFRTTASDKPPEGLVVDVIAGTWTFRDKTHKINECVPKYAYYDGHTHMREGPIGVYDKADSKNLDTMLLHSYEALRREYFNPVTDD